jgi:hypothetical protein
VNTLGLGSEKHCHVNKNMLDYYIARESLLIPEFRHIDFFAIYVRIFGVLSDIYNNE